MSSTASVAVVPGVDHRIAIAAPRERVWQALTQTSELRRWLFASASIDCRLGGTWEFTFPHWPSARGLWHPSLQFRGPIVELDAGAALAVTFSPPYFGTVRFSLGAHDDGTELRITQDGFEGPVARWLADFRGGWASFSDRLATLCEIEAVPTVQTVPEARGARVAVDPGEIAGRIAALPVGAHASWSVEADQAVLFISGGTAPTGWTNAVVAAHAALVVHVAPAAASAAQAALARSLARRGWGASSAAWLTRRGEQVEIALPYAPRIDLADPAPFVRAFERAFCAPGRAAAPDYFEPRGTCELAGRPHPRPVAVPLARLPREAIVRFDELQVEGAGMRAIWEGSGWTAGRNRGTSTWEFGSSGRIARLQICGGG